MDMDKFLCFICNKQYDSLGEIIKHAKGAHARTHPYDCIDCGNRFERKPQLEVHREQDCLRIPRVLRRKMREAEAEAAAAAEAEDEKAAAAAAAACRPPTRRSRL